MTFTPLGKAGGILKTCEMKSMAKEIFKDVSLKTHPQLKDESSSYILDLESLQGASISAALTF